MKTERIRNIFVLNKNLHARKIVIIINKVMSRNKHMKIVADAATLTGIAAGIGKTSKRVNDF